MYTKILDETSRTEHMATNNNMFGRSNVLPWYHNKSVPLHPYNTTQIINEPDTL